MPGCFGLCIIVDLIRRAVCNIRNDLFLNETKGWNYVEKKMLES
jgi:hypothetical protein